MSRFREPLCIVTFLTLSFCVARPASADFHFMRISEVMVGAGDDCRIQFVELQMEAIGQSNVSGHELFFYSATDELIGTYPLPDDVSNGADGSFILIGTAEFAEATDIEPDFILDEPYLMPHGGRVSFEGPTLQAAIDSVAYGIYTGPNEGYGLPAPALSVSGNQSLLRVQAGRPKENSTDFELGVPTPTNNAGDAGTVTPTGGVCFFEDNFDDISNWDEPTPNVGLDLNPCGLPAVVDIGSVSVDDNKLLFAPGLVDQLDLGLPISMTGMTVEAAAALLDEESYRVRFDMRARPGLLIAAVFTRQHYVFDDAAGTIDVSEGAGFGINFSFDSQTESRSDHAHPDIRLACLSEGSADGPGDVLFNEGVPSGLLTSDTDYTVTLDIEGDDIDGPLTLRAKVFEKDLPEPSPIGTWTMPFGLNAPDDAERDHGVLIAGLGQPGSALEITNFSICEIPPSQNFVRNLTCSRDVAEDTVDITWENPDEANAEPDIAIVVNDVEVDRIGGTESSYILDDPPDEDLTIQVINSSCVAATCSLCFNQSPVPDVVGETAVALPEDADDVTVTLDSRTSADAEDPEDALQRVWEVIAKPDGSVAQINDVLAPVIQLTVDTAGEYQIELSLTDNGCTGDFSDVATATVVHTLTVTSPTTDPMFRRGDDNVDGMVDVSDPISGLSFQFLGLEPPNGLCLDAMDFNDDGKVDVSDPIGNLSHQFLGSEAPKPPGKDTCGVDPTPDDKDPADPPGGPNDELGCETYPPEKC